MNQLSHRAETQEARSSSYQISGTLQTTAHLSFVPVKHAGLCIWTRVALKVDQLHGVGHRQPQFRNSTANQKTAADRG